MIDPISVTLRLSPDVGEQEIDQLRQLCELVVQDNVAFFERLANRGIEAPCCCACAGVRYRAPSTREYRSGELRIDGAAHVLETLRAACGGIACYDAAAQRWRGQNASVEIVEQPDLGPSYYHAVVATDEGLTDPSAALQAGKGCAAC